MEALAIPVMAGPFDDSDDSKERSDATAAATGGLAEFDRLMRRHERMVLGTALALLGNLADAEDAAQEVFLRLYRNLAKLDQAACAGWLYRVTVNVCRDVRRRRPAAGPEADPDQVPSGGADPHQAMAASERRRALALSLRLLSEKERAALVLRDLEGLSTEEVARALGSSEATVRSQISKARVKMRGFMERYFRRRA
jgi:RNA polymerase sigma-70 factor (ECF subfamily)